MTQASRWWSRSRPRSPLRRSLRYLLFLVLPIIALIGGLTLFAAHRLSESHQATLERRAEAQARVEEQAHAYADALIQNGDPTISDESLSDLAGQHSVRVIEVDRGGQGDVELVVTVLSSAAYYPGPFFGASSYARGCFEIVLADLGTDDARYGLATIEPCPPP